MKRNDKTQKQSNQAEQKRSDAIIRVRSGLRAGAAGLLGGCCPGDDAII